MYWKESLCNAPGPSQLPMGVHRSKPCRNNLVKLKSKCCKRSWHKINRCIKRTEVTSVCAVTSLTRKWINVAGISYVLNRAAAFICIHPSEQQGERFKLIENQGRINCRCLKFRLEARGFLLSKHYHSALQIKAEKIETQTNLSFFVCMCGTECLLHAYSTRT